MSAPLQLRQALRMMLLPERSGSERERGLMLRRFLQQRSVSHSDCVFWMSVQLGVWKDSGSPSADLRLLVRDLIAESDSLYGEQVSQGYFPAYTKLKAVHLLTHEEAVSFLSHAFMICDFADREKLSAAQIAGVLQSKDRRVPFSQKAVTSVLEIFQQPRVFELSSVEAMYRRDAALELPTFADSDVEGSSALVGASAARLGCRSEITEALQTLANGAAPYTYAPYMQMLYYQCATAEFFDHAVTDLYEFAPRGKIADWVFERFPGSFGGAGNPFLNNAKSVVRLDSMWVQSKKPQQLPGARALYEVLRTLEEMGFSSRRELARYIRMWVLRVLRLAKPMATILPGSLTLDQLDRLVTFVGQSNTATYGVLEQRTLDAATLVLHPQPDWRSRGVGDSVNATNTASRKLGDIDFQNSTNRRLIAYESHGGVLTDWYVQEHLRTLTNTLRLRRNELEGIADAATWHIEVQFVAHNLSATLPRTVVIDGLQVYLSGTTFNEFVGAVPPALLSNNFNSVAMPNLRSKRTPEEVRKRLLTAIE